MAEPVNALTLQDWEVIADLSPEELAGLLTIEQLVALHAQLDTFVDAGAWTPTEKQALAEKLSGEVFEILYGGAAGGGKSEWILMHMWGLSTRFPGHKGLILRRTYPELEESIILVSLEKYDQREATYKVGERRWIFNNNSIVTFRHMEEARDRFKFKSAAYEAIAFDELTTFLFEMYDYLKSRCRTTKARRALGVRPHLIGATNPGDIGGPWVKEYFIDVAPPGTIYVDPKDLGQRKRVFIQAKVDDNPHLDEDYRLTLDSMRDEVTRKQLRDGDWEAFEGRFFTRWNRDIHVIEPFEIPDWWPRERGLDWGYAAPFACVWGAWDPDGTLIIYAEAYKRQLTPREQAKVVREITGDDKVSATYADPSIWRSDGTGEPINVQYAKAGLLCTPGLNNRVAGWQSVNERMSVEWDTDGVPHTGLKVFSTCVNFIKTVPMLPRSERKPEDLDTDADDHLADALRYLSVTHGRKGRAPEENESEIDRLHRRHDHQRRAERRAERSSYRGW